MVKHKVLVVCKCVGGKASLGPVVELLKPHCDIVWIEHDRIEELNNFKPDIFITSVCSRIGRDVARDFLGICPIIAIQNQWTAGLDIWANESFKPNLVFVNDDLDVRQTLNAWSGFSVKQIFISGYPAMDKYADYDFQTAVSRVEENLGIDVSGRVPIVLFAGQWWQTGHALMETVSVLNEIGSFVHFIPRVHPRMNENSPEEIPVWEKALLNYRAGNLVINSSVCPISDLISVSTVVVSMFSTVLQEAAILRKQNIAVLYPSNGGRIYKTETGTDVSQYPMVALGATALAQNREEFLSSMLLALKNKLGLEENQKKAFRIDGNGAKKIVDVLNSLFLYR